MQLSFDKMAEAEHMVLTGLQLGRCVLSTQKEMRDKKEACTQVAVENYFKSLKIDGGHRLGKKRLVIFRFKVANSSKTTSILRMHSKEWN